MARAVPDIEARMLARTVAIREKALLIIRSARRPPVLVSLAPFAAILLFPSPASLHIGFWPGVLLEVACALSISLAAFAWHLYRQLLAVIDLILADRD